MGVVVMLMRSRSADGPTNRQHGSLNSGVGSSSGGGHSFSPGLRRPMAFDAAPSVLGSGRPRSPRIARASALTPSLAESFNVPVASSMIRRARQLRHQLHAHAAIRTHLAGLDAIGDRVRPELRGERSAVLVEQLADVSLGVLRHAPSASAPAISRRLK